MNIWRNVRLELAKTKEFPAGSVSRGYIIRLPFDDEDLLDREAFERSPHRATVRRYWSTEPDEAGLLIAIEDGWAMRSNGRPQRMLQLHSRPIRLGQQVSVVDADGTSLPFRVAGIQ